MATAVTYIKEPAMPFTPKNLDQLYAMRAPEITFVLYKIGSDPQYQINKYEDFKNKAFEELWDYASTPKFSLDRSIKDQLHDRQYG